MLNDPLSHGLWEATAPPAPETPPLEGEAKADVAVVGCGYAGLSAALRLAEAGARVVALEAVEIGYGGAGRNVGLVNAGMWVMPSAFAEALGPDYGERALTLLGDAPALVWDIIKANAIDCEATPSGTLHCAVGRKGLATIEERARQWGQRGAPVSVLSAAETARRVGGGAFAGALLDMRAGTIQPLAYARGLARAAIAAGAAIHTRSPVTAQARASGGVRLATHRGGVTAEWVIVATDAYGGPPFAATRREQVRLPYFNFATKPLGADLAAAILPGREGAWDTRTILSSFRLDRAGRLVFGSVGALRLGGLAVHRAWAKRAMTRLFPQLAGVEFERAWYGVIGMTANNLPRFHRFAPGVVGFCGYNGRGIGPGTALGRTLADHALGRLAEKDLPLPASPVETPPLATLREAFYEAGAQVAHGFGARL